MSAKKLQKLIFSYGKLVTNMNGGTSRQNVRQIRQTEIPGV